MGNESSVPVEDDVPPQTLESRTLEGVAKYIKETKVRRIVVMVRQVFKTQDNDGADVSHRRARVSVHPLAYQTFALPTQDSMQILPA